MNRLLNLGLTCVPLSGCATFGGTISGDFACRAVRGTCAPLTVNDAAALTTVTAAPAGPVSRHRPIAAAGASRSGERLLTILLPAHVDQDGVLHDAATVHVVVEPARWDTAPAGSAVSEALPSSRGFVPSLREVTAGASVSSVEGPGFPSPRVPQPATAAPDRRALDAARGGHRIVPPTVLRSDSSSAAATERQPIETRPLLEAPLAAPSPRNRPATPEMSSLTREEPR